ncbi:MAG: asparagine synthase (glutamine-hydrolyzing), partial [Phycisphaerae bacterium]|nr:asparagine synthase (glutamine-hydrolyzing) [Phycisphaerae bacterium]
CRGPDGQAIALAKPFGAVHTHLKIIDPDGGRQPMKLAGNQSADKLVVVFNGEIYNHRDLRRQLSQRGHKFRSDHSDTEVLLHGYREWGSQLPHHLEGMFALGLWDGAQQSLLLARDRTGKKPLFVYRDEGQFLFASTPAALLAGLGSAPSVDRQSLLTYLTLGYTLERSLLDGVEELPAATWMEISVDGATRHESYWQFPHEPASASLNSAAALRTLLIEAVERRLEADVPLGCFLSGGLDSSMVAALAQGKLSANGRRLRTFNLAMSQPAYDESDWARQVARHLGTDHHTLRAKGDVESDLYTLIASCGEPLGDSSILPTYWLSRAVREHVTVVLSGDGGDELFGGYERYIAMKILARHRWWLRAFGRNWFRRADPRSRRGRFRRLARAAAAPSAATRYASLVEIFGPGHLADLVGEEPPWPPGLPDWPEGPRADESARRWDLQHYLPFDLLRKVDRASMAVGLEVRCPMLDTSLVEAASSLDLRKLCRGRQTKTLLRRLAQRLLPQSVIQRRKMGFAVPIGQEMRDQLRPMLERNLLDHEGLVELGCRRDALENLIQEHAEGQQDHTHRLFSLLSLAIWQQWRLDSAAAR